MKNILLMLHRMRLYGGLAVLLASMPAAQAQTKVQVVTRTIEQTLPCPAGVLVRVRAEKATLRIQGWDKPTMRVVLRLIARHPERAVAEKELAVARHLIEKSGGVIDLVNYFALPPGVTAVRSDLRAEYTVQMPAGNPLQVINAYGQTYLTNLSGKQKLEQDFGQIVLQDMGGSLNALIRYADLNSTNTNFSFTCEADKSALSLVGAGGSYSIRNRYGSVLLEPTAELKSVFIDAQRTEVKIGVPQLGLYQYNLSTAHSTLTVPASYAGGVRKTTGQESLRISTAARLPLIRVLTSYAPITLQAQPLLIKR
ncbi:hypothetical protein [Hymenobacter sediminicola]|uniref:DUF4097 family beta strand repeat protein n=1 Tax=Hymenobacter sediminicola TaxID=2761579 RepID=A0A7G7W5G2_9BACT|nr:hypothetical protein [Hymenobacter sediminicola]QNH61605.1 hypothetical protein H4317_15790 [Hymenobacter sediminicola]